MERGEIKIRIWKSVGTNQGVDSKKTFVQDYEYNAKIIRGMYLGGHLVSDDLYNSE